MIFKNKIKLLSFKQIQKNLEEILAKYPVHCGYLFGSCAQGNQGPLSDLDLAIYLETNLKEEQQEKITVAIQEMVAKALHLPDKVDVVLLNQELPPALERNIVYDGKLIYVKDDAARAYYEADAIKRWLDYKPHHTKLMREIFVS